MKKIKTKILLAVVSATTITALFLGFMGSEITKKSTDQAITDFLSESIIIASDNAKNMINDYTHIVSEIATSPILTDPLTSPEEKKALIDTKVTTYYMRSGSIANLNGIDIFTGADISSEAFFQSALSGQSYLSQPYIDATKTDMHLYVAAPIKQGGITTSILYFTCDAAILSEIVEKITIGEEGTSYILDKNGTIIANSDLSLVYNNFNSIQEFAGNPQNKDLGDLAAIEQQMISGETGFGKYDHEGSLYFQSFMPIPESDGWSIAINVSEEEFMATAKNGSRWIFIFAIGAGIIGLIFASFIGNALSRPIIKCTDRLIKLAEGDLKSPMEKMNTKDETQILADKISELLGGFNYMITDISQRLSKISQGDMTLEKNQTRYKGDFAPMQESVEQINKNLKELIGEVATSSSQVYSGSNQVASGAQLLAQGAVEQASSIEELSATVGTISEQIDEIANYSKNASSASSVAKETLNTAIQYMENLLKSVTDINERSSEISKIVKTIDDIAFQTNILALNAAVEAARAGTAGKGFAVVADEVRSLANKSAQAAKSTTLLIQGSVSAAQIAANLSNSTSKALTEVSKKATSSGQAIHEITVQIEEQAKALSEINIGLEQISGVIQTTTATSEESAATAEQLSSQAELLRALIASFKLE